MDNHFLHKTNDLYLLFVDRELISTDNKPWRSSLTEALSNISSLKRNFEKSVKIQLDLIKTFDDIIEGI